MKSNSLVFYMIILVGIYLFSGVAAADIVRSEVDETNLWVKHTIDDTLPDLRNIAVGDINGDGKIDVVTARGNRNSSKSSDAVYWYEAPGWTMRRISSENMPIRWSQAQTVGDVDNDGDLDVVAGSFDDSNVYLSINPLAQGGDVNSEWETVKILNSPGNQRDGERIEIIDIDGDGFNDVVFPRGSPKEVHVLFNPSGVVTNKWQNKIIGTHAGSDAHDIIVADLDLDGDLDIVSASGDGSSSGKVYWYEHPNGNPRGNSWKRHNISSTSANYGGLQINDVDKDGRPDVLATESHKHPGKVAWYKNPNPSSGSWRRFVIDTQYSPHQGLAFDINGDGVQEYWVPDTECCGSPEGGIVYYSIVNGVSNEWVKHRVADAPETARGDRSIDMDSDGDLDVVTTFYHRSIEKRDIIWWENRTASLEMPNAVISSNSTSGEGPLTVNFSGSGSSDSNGTLTNYEWNFGDGSISSEINPTYTYTGVGTYNVVLTVTDNDGNTNSSSLVIVVTSSDTIKPVIDSVVAFNASQVTVVFSEPVEAVSAAMASNYSIDNGIIVTNAVLGADLMTVTLTTSRHTDGVTYLLTVNGVKDDAMNPNTIVTNSNAIYTFAAQLILSNLSVSSENDIYEVVQNGLSDGALVYIDRSYGYGGVPASLRDATYIKTANGDKSSTGTSFLTFGVNQDVTLYIAHDDRIISKPAWLSAFIDTGQDIIIAGETHSLWRKDFSAGAITFGGNEGIGRFRSMYTVIVVEKGTTLTADNRPPNAPTGLILE